MSTFEEMLKRDHEQVSHFYDQNTGLRCIIGIHNTILGPGLGGCRIWKYKNENDALVDVLRLSRGMTYKAAIAGLNLGGGKAVIIEDENTEKNESFFRSFGRFVEGMGGRYITAEDVGTSVRDMEWCRAETDYVVGISRALGGSGDPSVVTAYGVYIGIKACIKERLNKKSLDGLKIAIQGLGHVGMYLLEYLSKHDMEIYVTDISEEKVQEAVSKYNTRPVNPDEIIDLNVDIFAPCALGSVLNDNTISIISSDEKISILKNFSYSINGNSAISMDQIEDKELNMGTTDLSLKGGWSWLRIDSKLKFTSEESEFKQPKNRYSAM